MQENSDGICKAGSATQLIYNIVTTVCGIMSDKFMCHETDHVESALCGGRTVDFALNELSKYQKFLLTPICCLAAVL